LLNVVNTTHQSILSNDVLSALGETRNPEGGYSDKVLYSKDLTEPESEGIETDAGAEYARQKEAERGNHTNIHKKASRQLPVGFSII